MYERVWDEADYVVPPAENGAFFVTTNVVITPNQTRTACPEENRKEFLCDRLLPTEQNPCKPGLVANMVKGHGTQTGRCVASDRQDGADVCEIHSWCPVEVGACQQPYTSRMVRGSV